MDDKGKIYPAPSPKQVEQLGLIPLGRPLNPSELRSLRIAPNSPCGCGSGRKFKRCCYNKGASSPAAPEAPKPQEKEPAK